MKLKRILLLLLTTSLLFGCKGSKSGDTTESDADVATMDSLTGSYYKIVNLGGSDLRESFYTDTVNTNDYAAIGRDLQLLSADHFSTSKYYMSEGQYIDRDLSNEFLQWKGDYCIQPKKGTVIEDVESPIMFSNLQEQDYYEKSGNSYTLKGVSIAIILDPCNADLSELSTPFTTKTLNKYSKEAIKKMYKYITNSKDDNLKKIADVPILLTVYEATDANSTLHGHYIYSCYCNGKVGDIKSLDKKYVLFTSDDAKEIDKTTSDEFTTIKSAIKSASIEAASIVGEAKYENGNIQYMIITATFNCKTITELQYLTSLLADQIDDGFTYDFDCYVKVNTQDGLMAMIIKNKGSTCKSTMLY